MKRIKKCIIFVFLLVVMISYLPVFAANKKTIKDIKKYENIVFFGDSITEYYPIEEIYGDLPVVKSGKAGYKTTDVMDKLDDMVYKYNPTSVYILLGTNDIIDNKEENKKSAITNLKTIIKDIKKNKKKVNIYVESLLPINKSLDPTRFRVGNRSNEMIQDINTELKKICEEEGYTYIDMYNELIDEDGDFSEDYTDDGLHPNDLGYAAMTRILLTYIYDIK